jgi:hypothetical protein
MHIPDSAGPPEVTGLGTAQHYASAMHGALAEAVPQVGAFVDSLTGNGVALDAQAVAAASRAQELTVAAEAAWARATAALGRQTTVREAYAAVPDAGTKQFVTDAAAPGTDQIHPAALAQSRTPDPAVPASAEPRTPEDVQADRRAKAEVVLPLAQLDWIASHIAEAAEDGDADPDELLDRLLTAVRQTAAEAGLGPPEVPGQDTTYDPQRHRFIGDAPQDPGAVRVVLAGQSWNHGGQELVLREAAVVPVDAEHGAHLLTTATGLDEDGGERVWLDDSVQGRLECYDGPGWYHVESTGPCGADDESCPNAGTGTCDGTWVFLYRTDEGEAQGVHHAPDTRVILDHNDVEDGDDA